MDSGNSGSMQSSSGGDEEYESRADSITAAFMTHPQPHVGSMGGSFHHPQSSSAMFDPLSNLFDPRSSLANPNPLLNIDMLWSRNLRSDQIPPDLGGLGPNSSAGGHTLTSLSTFSGVQNIPQPLEGNALRGTVLGSDQMERNINININNNGGGGGGGGGPNVMRNSKKRPRASRRAPTTVLTTDTSNFRAMVQEFTGIPAPPFTAASPFQRNTRFDLFGAAAAASTIRSATHLDVQSTQPYLLRPFPQKPPFLSPSLASTPPSSTNDLNLLKQPPNFLSTNMQNPVFDIHNMFHSNPKFPSSTNKPQSSSNLEIMQNDQNLKMGIFEEFGLSSHGHSGAQLSGLPPAGEALPSTTRENISNPPPPENWVGEGADSEQALNRRSTRGSNGKLRYSSGTATPSEFLGDKAAENATARTEGMVEPWICSSD